MDKVRIEIAIDRDLVAEAERQGLDVGAEVERGLRRRLGHIATLTSEEQATVKLQVERYNAHVAEHGLFADRWRRF